MINRLLIAWLVNVLFANLAFAAESFNGIYISEFSANNLETFRDDDGDHPGWIELYNGGSATVNLAGWFLSNSSTDPALWRFPRVGIPANNYLIVFASGKGRTNDPAHLHTNFRLSKDGGYLALIGRATNVVSGFAYPESPPNISYGRVAGEPSIIGPFSRPTPGKPNQTSGNGFAPSVRFSRSSGSFLEPFTLDLSTDSTNALIHYTLDGSLPNAGSPVYSEALQITNTAWVRTRAYQDGLLPGPAHGETYILFKTNILGWKSNLPVLVIDTLGTEHTASLRSQLVQFCVYEPVDGTTSFERQPTLTTRAGIHQRGSSSAGFPQPSFAVEFVDELNHELSLSLLRLPPNSDWVLYAPNQFDPIMIHNPFVHDLSRQMGHWSPRTRFVEVFLATHSGPITQRDYFGVYVLEEKIKIGKHRVAIDRLGPEDLEGPAITGGYLLKFDREGPGENGFWAGGASMIFVDPKESVIELPQRAPQREYIQSWFDGFQRALRSPNWKDTENGYRAYIDVDAWIDFHVLEVLSGNVDIFRFSTFFYKPRGGKLTFGPHWDFDRALGSIDHRDADPNHWNTGNFFNAPWWNRLFTDPDFWQLWVDRWQEMRRTNFSEAHLFALIDQLTSELRTAQPREAKRWDLEPRGESYQSEIDWMKAWLGQRVSFIDRQLVQPPKLTLADGRVTLSAVESSTIYYTVDGSDPRISQGGISSNAVVYARPVELKPDGRLIARARNPSRRQTGGPPISTPWSSPVKITGGLLSGGQQSPSKEK